MSFSCFYSVVHGWYFYNFVYYISHSLTEKNSHVIYVISFSCFYILWYSGGVSTTLSIINVTVFQKQSSRVIYVISFSCFYSVVLGWCFCYFVYYIRYSLPETEFSYNICDLFQLLLFCGILVVFLILCLLNTLLSSRNIVLM